MKATSKRSSRVWTKQQSSKPTIVGLSSQSSIGSYSRGRRSVIFGGGDATTFGLIRRKLSVREEATMREIFDLFDDDSDGIILIVEFGLVIQSLLGMLKIYKSANILLDLINFGRP